MKNNFIGLFDPANFDSRTLLASGSVTLANMKISAVDAAAFVDFSLASVLTDYLNRYLEITDSGGEIIGGYIKAAGTGETLSAEREGAFVNRGAPYDYDTFTVSAPDITSAIVVSGAGQYTADGVATISTDGMLSKTAMNLTLNSGQAPKLTRYIGAYLPDIDPISAGSTTLYATKTDSATYGSWLSSVTNTNDCNWSMLFSVKQVLTPASTGVTIVSTSGGATYNWAVQESGFDYNDASGYTYEIRTSGP